MRYGVFMERCKVEYGAYSKRHTVEQGKHAAYSESHAVECVLSVIDAECCDVSDGVCREASCS